MEAAMTIQDFGALLQSEQESNPLLEILRSLTTLDGPETVRVLKGYGIQSFWMGWH